MSIEDEVAAQAAGRIVEKWRNKVIELKDKKTRNDKKFSGAQIWAVLDAGSDEVSYYVREYMNGFLSKSEFREDLNDAVYAAINIYEIQGTRKFGDSIPCYLFTSWSTKPKKAKLSELVSRVSSQEHREATELQEKVEKLAQEMRQESEG